MNEASDVAVYCGFGFCLVRCLIFVFTMCLLELSDRFFVDLAIYVFCVASVDWVEFVWVRASIAILSSWMSVGVSSA